MPELPSFLTALRLWLKVGLLSFGGPAAQIALMHKLVVEERKWLGETRFLHALNYCMLLPGPEAQQLATYLGWMLHRTAGGLAAGLLFILPGALCILALSFLYVWGNQHPLVQGVFHGLQAAVCALVLEAVLRVAKKALHGPLAWGLAAAALVAVSVGVPFPLVILSAALVGLVWVRPSPKQQQAGENGLIDQLIADGRLPHLKPTASGTLGRIALWLAIWWGPVGILWAWLGREHLLVQLACFFSELAVVTFGGAYAVLAYVAQAAVQGHGWLSAHDMMTGLGLAETTPGPLILVLQFVGFVAGWNQPGHSIGLALAGAAVALWCTFAPCFLWILAGAPWVERLRQVRPLSGALAAITASVVGVIAHLGLWFASHVLFTAQVAVGPWQLPRLTSADPLAWGIAIGAGMALLRYHVPLGWVLITAVVAGGMLHGVT